jgi:hypothetical protein
MVNLFVQEARNESGVCNRIVQFPPTNRHLFVNIAHVQSNKRLMCYLQFMVNGYLIQQRVVFRLDFDQAPKMSIQFMNNCLGISRKTYEGSRIFKV